MARRFIFSEAVPGYAVGLAGVLSDMDPVEQVRPIFELTVPFDAPLSRRLAAPLKSSLEKLLLLRKLDRFYAEVVRGNCELHFIERILKALDISFDIGKDDLARVPRDGPLVVVANHPFGMVDGVILSSIVRSVRPDFKLLTNFSLSGITELCDTLIPVDPYGKSDSIRANTRPVREAITWLQDGGALGVFPAGEVAHIDWRERVIADPEWNASIARMVRKTRAQTLPVFLDGSNGFLFQLAGLVHPRLRTALLPREFLNKRGKKFEVRIGSPLSFERLRSFESDEEIIDYLRRRTCLLINRCKTRDPKKPAPSFGRTAPPRPILPGSPAEVVAKEICALPEEQTLLTSDPFTVFHASAEQIPMTLREIGRLREITFRKVNEGTGKESDLDEFDSHYVHLFLWNGDTNEIVGAYRLGKANEIACRFGVRGLYTHTLFDYDRDFLDRMDPALELGRSFVRPEYQKTFMPLFLLLKGIGKYVALQPQYKTLFGPVSISNDYQPISRKFIAECLGRPGYRHELAHLVEARSPFRYRTTTDRAFRLGTPLLEDIDEVSAVISDIETDRKGIPVMLKHYLRLGGKLLGFNVDHNFSDVLDGLILVDLTRSERGLLTRLMGEESAARFLEFHSPRYLLAS